MRWADSATMQAGISGARMMDRAGQAVAHAVQTHMPDFGRVVIVTGPGNNGGDGFAAAIYLRRSTMPVTVVSLVPLDSIKGDAREFYEKAAGEGVEILAAYPFEGIPHMLLGDIKLRRQDIIGAAIEYRKAIDLNPDFLDKKADEFQGKKIKKTVEESLTEIEAAIQNGDSSLEMREKRNIMYYMLRKIAGSCS